MAVLDAAAGQNGFGNAFGAPAAQGNGNQVEEEEAAEPDEPVSLSPVALLLAALVSLQSFIRCINSPELLYVPELAAVQRSPLVRYSNKVLVMLQNAFASRPWWQFHDSVHVVIKSCQGIC